MFKKLKKLFYNQTKETINIFEENTRIDYDPSIFLSLKMLSLTDSPLNYLPPLSVFANLEILNLSNNQINDIDSLKDLKKLKIIDLRFNNIEKIPLWVFKSDKTIYWKRVNDEQEGIFLEGNPLKSRLIDKIKNHPINKKIVPLLVQKQESIITPLVLEHKKSLHPLLIEKKEEKPSVSIEPEQLIPLNRQRVTLLFPQSFSSEFINTFISNENHQFKLNIFTLEYNDNYKIVEQKRLTELKYIILILKEKEEGLNTSILERLSKEYKRCKIFLIIENRKSYKIPEKITYNKSIHIIKVYHSFDKQSNEDIKEEIYNYLENTQEANSLWRKNWIELRDEIEANKNAPITHKEFQTLADKYALASEERDDIFAYLKRVGSIK